MSDPFGRDRRPRRPAPRRRFGGPSPDLARSLLDFMDEIGAEPLTPAPGQKITLVVLPLTADPDHRQKAEAEWPNLAARIVVMKCSRCSQDCWVDPNSFGAADPDLVCIDCLKRAVAYVEPEGKTDAT